MYTAEPEANPRAALDRICVEVQEVQRVAEITQKKLDLERAAVAAADERARRLESQLQEEKALSLLHQKRANDLDVKLQQTCKELEDEKLRLQGARQRIVLRESQLRVFHSTVTTVAKIQQDQFSTMLRTLENDVSDDNPGNTNVQSTTSPCTTRQVNQEIHLGSEVDGSWAVPNPITAPNERRDHQMKAISKTNCKEVKCLASHFAANEYQPSWWGNFEHEDDDVSLRQGLLPSEEVPMLLTEVVPDYENPQQHYAHCAVSPSTRILDIDGNGELSSPHRELNATFDARLKWRTGEMASVIAGLRDSNCIFFSKLLSHTQRALHRRTQLYLPVWFINQYGDRLGDSALLRTRSSTKTWRVRICYFRKPRGSARAQIFCGWNGFIVDNDLKRGDSLIFDLIVEASCFQVYIFRSSRR